MRTEFNFLRGSDCYNEDIPEARWNVPGLFVFDELYYKLWDIDKNYMSGKPPVDSISGSRNVLWNSGRVARSNSNKGGTKAAYQRRLEIYKQFGVNAFYTFSNNLLTEKDMQDRECNEMLEAMVDAGHDGDGVILSSDILSDYLRKNYPTLKQKVSVVKSDVERPQGRDAAWYNELADKYDIVVFQPDDNFNLKLLSDIKDKKRFELLVNEGCVRDCPMRKTHYETIAEIAKNGYRDYGPLKRYTERGGVCGMFNFTQPNPEDRPKKTSCRMKKSEVKEAYDLGYRYFKLQGRLDPVTLAYDIAYYLYEDGHTSKAIYSAMMTLITQMTQ